MDRVRVRVVEAGRLRCTLLEMVPGVPGTSLAVETTLARLGPSTLAADVDVLDVVSFRKHVHRHAPLPFGAEQVRRALDAADQEVEVQNPYQAAAAHARASGATFVPLVPERARPGLFQRRRLGRAFAAAARSVDPEDPSALAALWPQVARHDPSYRPRADAEDSEVWRRFRDLVAREQAVRVCVLVRPPLAERLANRLEAELLPRAAREGVLAVEEAALEPSEVGKGLR